jgi:hypothetical protein
MGDGQTIASMFELSSMSGKKAKERARAAFENYINEIKSAQNAAGEELGTTLGETTEASFSDTLLPAANEMFAQIGEKGAEFLSVDMKNAVVDFLNDNEKGMAALQSAAEKLNAELAKEIVKKVTIHTSGGGFSSSVNTNVM